MAYDLYSFVDGPAFGNLVRDSTRDTPTHPLATIAFQQGSGSRVDQLLERVGAQQDLHELGQLTSKLVHIGNASEGCAALQQWIQGTGKGWVRERRVALSAVIEAAVRLSLTEAETLIEQVLANPNSPVISASVAAQRARRLSIADASRRAKIAKDILRWIEIWEISAPTSAALALPSLPHLLGMESLGELSARIERAPTLIAWGAATGLSDWLVERPHSFSREQATPLFEAIRGRIQRDLASPPAGAPGPSADTPDLPATLVLLLGQVATIGQVEATASIIARAFLTPRGLEDATAVQAGRMLVERLRVPAMRALSAAFGSALDEFHRLSTLIISSK